jgi:two-component system sensor histidine kinase UhpB
MSIPCRLALGENLPELPMAQAIAVYRIVEEALTNIMRHSGATRVDVAARVEEGSLRVSVCDNGRGITEDELAVRRNFGVTSMMERAALLGGDLRIERGPDGGTRIWLEIPLVRMHEHAGA